MNVDLFGNLIVEDEAFEYKVQKKSPFDTQKTLVIKRILTTSKTIVRG